MGLINDEHGFIPLCNVHKIIQRRAVPVHAVETFDRDPSPARRTACAPGLKRPLNRIGVIVGEMAIALNIPKAAARAAAIDFIADVRREERQTRREETSPDKAMAYARIMASLGDTPLGQWAKGKAEELDAETPEPNDDADADVPSAARTDSIN